MIERTALEAWIQHKIVGNSHKRLTQDLIVNYQLEKLNQVITKVKHQSRFYRKHLNGIQAGPLKSITDIQQLPFTTPRDVVSDPVAFGCVPQPEISRVMTINTSGTTGKQKRIFFTDDDQEATTDFFHHGMSNLADSGDRFLILLPGELPGSVGDLLKKALNRFGVTGIINGPVNDIKNTLIRMMDENITGLVGIPVQVLALVRQSTTPLPTSIKSVLLTTDYVSDAISSTVEQALNCKVFNHYGATEMGLGGGVQCKALHGLHMREADIFFEIIDPHTGYPVKDGEYGEVCFTSLTARGMPFIRYRTGDISRFLPDRCPCGTCLKSLEIVSGRIPGKVAIGEDKYIEIRQIDEILFRQNSAVDFDVTLKKIEDKRFLTIEIYCPDSTKYEDKAMILEVIRKIPEIGEAETSDGLEVLITYTAKPFNRGTSKRIIRESEDV